MTTEERGSRESKGDGWQAGRSDYQPGSMPRSCTTVYRGYLAREPKRIPTRSGHMTVARIGVNMAAAKTTPEERDELTEWVEVVAFREMGERLYRMGRGELVIVMGYVTLHFFNNREGKTRIERTITAESLMGAGASTPRTRSDTIERIAPETAVDEVDAVVDGRADEPATAK